ncbi:MAG TPA: DNA-3-methyladenine glycosylase I [Candidatus Wallbacteria bacterium]|nr:DNA-3-methyladenine glycosylase I [Candidatus Wallbacteria bacterium]
MKKELTRCPWCLSCDIYIDYHDREWGVPVHDDRTHFEFLVLESAQAGLSWLTVLRKRENYRKAYFNFEPKKVAKFGAEKVAELMKNEGLIRNLKKIEASINNAARFLEIQKEFGSFDEYIWSFTDGKQIVNKWLSLKELPAKTDLSDEVSKDLKKRGFKFLGSTVIYAHLQATGIINDHLIDCYRYSLSLSN